MNEDEETEMLVTSLDDPGTRALFERVFERMCLGTMTSSTRNNLTTGDRSSETVAEKGKAA